MVEKLEVDWDTYDEFLKVMGLNLDTGYSAKFIDLQENDRGGPHALARDELSSFCSVGAVRSILLGCIKLFGFGTMASVFRVAGAEYSRLRARQLIENGTIKPRDLEGFLEWVAYDFENWGYGKLKVVSMNPSEILIRVDESMSASGMNPIGRPVCYYEGGRITGGLSVVAECDLAFREIKCWGMGDDYCLFSIAPVNQEKTIY